MPELINIPAGPRFGTDAKIGPLFYNTGLSGYFMLAAEIPQRLLNKPAPKGNYKLGFFTQVPTRRSYQHPFRLPTITEALWAVGYMPVPLANQICRSPLRFLHRPFRLHEGPGNASIWRQLLVRRAGSGYHIETVPAAEKIQNVQLAYVFDPDYNHLGSS